MTATREVSPFLGKAMTNKDLNMKFWIANTKNKGIMGADFPEENHCDILYSERILKINGENLENDVIPLLLLNITDRPQVLYTDYLVCMCEPVSEIMDFSQQNPPSVNVDFAKERIILD